MNIETKNCIVKIIEFADSKESEYRANKIPNTLLKAPVYHYNLEYNDAINVDTVVSELTGWGLIITTNHIINADENKFDFKIDCTKYFYDKSDRQANYGQWLPYPNYIKHYDNYFTEDYHYDPKVQPIPIDPEPPIIDNTLQYQITKINTDNLLLQIKKEVIYQKSTTIGLQELTYNNTLTGRLFDHNIIYDYLNSFAYSISITIDDSNPLNQTTTIKFTYMSK